MSLEEKLAKIKSPNLQSQQHTAIVLESVEETLKKQGTPLTPTSYFASLLALVEKGAQTKAQNQQDDTTDSIVYLLDLFLPHVSPSLLRSKFEITANHLRRFLNPANTSALLRSTLGCFETVLIAQNGAAWTLSSMQLSPRTILPDILLLAVDSRPKIRKRAQEALTRILANPPPGPRLDHPASDVCAVLAQDYLRAAVEDSQNTKKQRGRADDSHEPGLIHALHLIKSVATAARGWPSKNIESLCELLLNISRSRNDYLVMSAFEVFEVIFQAMKDEVVSSKLLRLLEAIVELKPAQSDSQLLPPWIAIVSSGYASAAEIEPEDTFAKLPELFDLISPFLTSSSHNIRVSASECLISFLANCVPDSVILEPSIYDEKVLEQLAGRAQSFLSLKYQTAWMEVFSFLSAMFDALRWRGDPFLLPIVQAVGDLRSNEGFQGKKAADDVLGHAIRNLGPAAVLTVLPHNLSKPKPKQPGRAWILPLLRDYVSNTTLAHFRSDLVPLSEAMFQRVLDHGAAEKTIDIKIFETVVQQVWATLPGYCSLPLDISTAFDQSFAELLSNLLYQQADLRVDICRGLQNLVESFQAVITSDVPDEELLLEHRMIKAEAAKGLQHLGQFASNLLAVLFNVYSQVLPQSRAYVLQCINAYLSITPEKDLVETFDRVQKLLQSELPDPSQQASKPTHQPSKDKMPPTSHTLLDLVIALSVYLPRSSFGALFSLASNILTNPTVFKSDPQLIKKAYKLIPRLATSDTGRDALRRRNSELQKLILTTSEQTPVPARRDRLLAILALLEFLPVTELHFITSILSEVVLACKDSNEKARNAGFDLLIAAANKISNPENPKGTVIRNNLVPHMPDNSPDAPATIEEVFTMISAGLAGVAPHMVAASIIALSRLFFEFHTRLPPTTKEELVDTVTMFLETNNREIVRSVLGFVKVMIVILPSDMLEPRMSTIIPGLMVWSKENKGRLRAKVKGILERSMRKFPGSKVEEWVGPEDRKMAVNIRKRRERAKRKKAGDNVEEDSDDDMNSRSEKKFDNEFDEAVYGSDDDESEIDGGSGDNEEDSDEEMVGVSLKKGPTSSKHRKQKDQFIRLEDEDDEPLDLLDPRSLASISSSKKNLLSGRANLKKRAKPKYNEDGKLVFDDADVDTAEPMSGIVGEGEKTGGNAINAYLDAVDGPDAVRRGQKGRLKVKSGMQKKSTSNKDEMDLDEDDVRAAVKQMVAQNGRSPKSQRRGLGVDKRRDGNTRGGRGGGEKFRGQGVGRRNVRFGNGGPRQNRGGGRSGSGGGRRGLYAQKKSGPGRR